MGDAFIIDAVRTPLGRRGGALADIRADDLAAIPLRALVQRSGIDPALIEDVVLGCVTQVGEQAADIARQAALIAGFPVGATAVTVNRMGGSAQQAIHFAAMGVASGHQDLVVAGGVEHVTRVAVGSDGVVDGRPAAVSSELSWRFTIVPQGESAELVAERYGLTRGELDAYALESHMRAVRAADEGQFDAEIVPVAVGGTSVVRDEGPRRDADLDTLGALLPAFVDGGVITTGSSSQVADGAAALLLASERAVCAYGLRPRARIVTMTTAGVDPTLMLTGAIPATRRALERACLSIDEIDAVEIDEAFASVALGCGRALGLDPDRTNAYGGAIALGHPLGASGARLMTTLLGVLEQRGGRLGLCTMSTAGGQGITTIIDREIYT